MPRNRGAGALLTVALTLSQVLLSWVWTSTLQTAADSPFTRHWLFFLTLAVAVGMSLVNGTPSRVVAATLLGRSRRLGPALRASVGRHPALLAVAVVQFPVVWISALRRGSDPRPA